MKGIAGLITTTNSTNANKEGVESEDSDTTDSDDTSSNPSTVAVEEQDVATPSTEREKNLVTIVERIRGDTIHKLRLDGTVEVYKLYCELLYPVVVGKQKWKMNHCHIGIKTLTTVADEALVALLLENNIEEWVVLAKGGEINAMQRKTKYTHGGPGKNGTKKGGVWKVERDTTSFMEKFYVM